MERLEELEKSRKAITSYIEGGGRKEKILDVMKRIGLINK